MRRLEWHPAARADLSSVIDYIAADNLDAAIALLEEIETKVERLTEHPRLYRAGRVAGTREMVDWPNYVVVYSEHPSAVRILRVLHAAQRWP